MLDVQGQKLKVQGEGQSHLAHELPKGGFERLLKSRRGGRSQRGFNGFFSQRPMIAQILKRGEQIVSKSVARRDGRDAIDVRNRQMRQPIFQLENDSLRCLAADTGNARQARDICALYGSDQLARLDA